MDLCSRGHKNPLCKLSWSYDDCYYIDFMVRTDPRITDTQTNRHTHPQTTSRVSVETYRTRGETIGFKKPQPPLVQEQPSKQTKGEELKLWTCGVWKKSFRFAQNQSWKSVTALCYSSGNQVWNDFAWNIWSKTTAFGPNIQSCVNAFSNFGWGWKGL